MRPLTVSTTIDAPRERVFDYLADIANHVEFTDHFLKDFRLERLDSVGVGAAARFRIAFPIGSIWADAVITELERPYRIVTEGQAGRIGRVRLDAVYVLVQHGYDMTSVEFTFSSEPATRSDRLRESLGLRPWLKLQHGRALRRLKFVLEQGEPSTRAVTVAPG